MIAATVFPAYINDVVMQLTPNALGGVIVEAIFPGRDPFRSIKDRHRFVGAVGSGNEGFRADGYNPDHSPLVTASSICLFEDQPTRDLGAPRLDFWPDIPGTTISAGYHWGIFRPDGALRVTYRTHLFGRKYTRMFSFAPIDYTTMTAADATRHVRARADAVAAWMTEIRTDRREQWIDGLRSRSLGRLNFEIRWRHHTIGRALKAGKHTEQESGA